MAIEPVAVCVPRRPQVQESPPRKRVFAVLPLRALDDERLTDGAVRTLAKVCSWTNRAGITWVSQTRIAADSKVARQVIHKHMQQLKQHGYIELLKRGRPGAAGDTIRVLYDPQISAVDAISIASSTEDSRPPFIIALEQSMQSIPPKRQQKIIADMLAAAVKPMPGSSGKPPGRQYTMPADGQTVAAKRIRAVLKKEAACQPKGDNRRQPVGCTISLKTLGIEATDECERDLFAIADKTVPDELAEQLIDEVLARYAAEGITHPRPALIIESILGAYVRWLQSGPGRAPVDDQGAG